MAWPELFGKGERDKVTWRVAKDDVTDRARAFEPDH